MQTQLSFTIYHNLCASKSSSTLLFTNINGCLSTKVLDHMGRIDRSGRNGSIKIHIICLATLHLVSKYRGTITWMTGYCPKKLLWRNWITFWSPCQAAISQWQHQPQFFFMGGGGKTRKNGGGEKICKTCTVLVLKLSNLGNFNTFEIILGGKQVERKYF